MCLKSSLYCHCFTTYALRINLMALRAVKHLGTEDLKWVPY